MTMRTMYAALTLWLLATCCHAWQPRLPQRKLTNSAAATTAEADFVTPVQPKETPTVSQFSSIEVPLSPPNEALPKEEEYDEEEAVVFPPPLSPIQRLRRAATFWRTALPLIAQYLLLVQRSDSMSPEAAEAAWEAQHKSGAARLCAVVSELQGFYVKTAQVVASRQDLFPEQYTTAMAGFTDQIDPLPTSLVKAVVRQELLLPTEKFDDVFVEFDDEPVGSASVAQVHRAVLRQRDGSNRTVAVKVQRPGIEAKLLGDVNNLVSVSRLFQDNPALPLDYHTVFLELRKQLADEFDFVAEAAAMERIALHLQNNELVIPRPVPGYTTRRVLVMDYLEGVPLSRARDEMIARGIDPDSPEAKLMGRRLLQALTSSFGTTILETGFFHADPHPGNIFVMNDGRIGLIDFGQVKQISSRNRETLCRVMVALAERGEEMTREDEETVGKLSAELGVTIREDAPKEAGPAIAIWLFDGTANELPGGYDMGELSPNSPVRQLAGFPQDLVLVGRSSILIKGLSSRLGIPWSLANEWSPIAKRVLKANEQVDAVQDRVRFRQVRSTFGRWWQGRVTQVTMKLPRPVRARLASVAVRMQGRNDW